MKYIALVVLILSGLYSTDFNATSALYLEAKEVINEYNGEEGGLDRAREILHTLESKNPESPEVLFLKGRLLFNDAYVNRNNYNLRTMKKVERIAKKAIEKYPNRIDGYILYAAVLRNSGLKEVGLMRSKEILDQAKKLDKNNIRLKLSYMEIANRQKDDSTVIKYANELLDLPLKAWQKSSVYSCLTTAYYRTREYDKAKSAYLKIIELAPASPWALINYSSFLRKRKDYDAAIVYAKKSLALADLGMGRYVLSRAYYAKGYALHWKQKDKVNSRKWFQLCVDTYPSSVDCHYGLGASYYYTGYVNKDIDEIKRAKEEYQICQKLNPDHKLSRKQLYKVNKLLSRVE